MAHCVGRRDESAFGGLRLVSLDPLSVEFVCLASMPGNDGGYSIGCVDAENLQDAVHRGDHVSVEVFVADTVGLDPPQGPGVVRERPL